MKTSLLFVAFAFVFIAVAHSLPTAYEAGLNGANEAPVPVSTSAVGRGFVIFETTDPNSLRATLYRNTVVNATLAHIHNCAASCAGPVYINLTPNLPTFNSITYSSGLLSDLTFPDFLNQVILNNTYFNVHSNANPGGEIRGQLTLSPNFYISQLNSINEIPGCNATGFGTATILIQDNVLFITVEAFVASPTAMHIHIGPANVSGPIAVNLTPFLPLPNYNIVVDLRNTTIQGGFNITTVLSAIRSGNAYVNVHNGACPAGAVRSQTVLQSAPSLFTSSITSSPGSQPSPSPASNGSSSPSPQGGNGGGAASSVLSWLSLFQ